MWYDRDAKPREECKRIYNQRIKLKRVVAERGNDLEEITGGNLSPGIQYRFVTNKAFNAITVLKWIADKYEILECSVAVYRMNQASVRFLRELIEGVPCKIVVSNFFRENKKYEAWAKELVAFGETSETARVAFALNHAKVFTCKTKCGKLVVFEGSGNLSDNSRVEQYLIEDNAQTYAMHELWISEILDK